MHPLVVLVVGLGFFFGQGLQGLAASSTQEVSVEVHGEASDTEIVLRNPFLEVVLSPHQRPGMIDRFLYRPTGEDLSALPFFPKGEGIGTQRTNYGYLFHEARDTKYRILESGPKRASVEVLYTWQKELDGQAMDFLFTTRYTLEKGDSRLKVDWQITNRAPGPRSIAPWLKHTAQAAERGRHLGIQAAGPVELPTDRFLPAPTNWMARVEPPGREGGHTFFTLVEHEKVHEFYHWRGDRQRYTHEVIYRPALLEEGASWQGTYFLGVAPALPGVAFASPEGAVAMAPLRSSATGEVSIDLQVAGVTDLGRVRLEGELLQDERAVMPLGPRYVQWQPGRVEQAHYSLNLPEPGVYHLRLNAYDADGEQIALGETVGAFERVIEIPLVVGEIPEDTVVSAPWPKEPVVYQAIAGRDLPLPRLGELAGLQVAAGHPAQRVFREDRLAAEEKAPLAAAIERSAARGEWESIPLLIFAADESDETEVTLAVSALTHVSLDARIETLRTYEVSHVLTETPSRLRNLPVGRYPDPLLPLKGSIRVPANENVNLWINVQVPTGVPAGRYEGRIDLEAGGKRLSIPLHLNVWDFDLPHPASLRTWAGFVGWNVPRQMAWQGVEDYDPAAFREQLYRWCVDYGFAPGHGARYTLEELAALDQSGRGLSTLFGGGRNVQAWATPEQVEAHGWSGRVYQYAPFDEHGDHAVPQVAAWSRAFREVNPHIKVVDVYYGTHTQPLYGLVDVWCRQIERLPWVQERMAAGDEFWGVNSRLLWGIEDPLLAGRQEYWQLFDHGYTGQLLWSVAAWGYQPPDYRALGNNALAMMLYPTPEGPTTSIRWENLRDGLEDYDYLTLLRQRMNAARERKGVDGDLLEEARRIVEDPLLHARLTDTLTLEALRQRIAELIVAFGER